MELLVEASAGGEQPILGLGDSVLHCLPRSTTHHMAEPRQSEGRQAQGGLGGRLEQPALRGAYFGEAIGRLVLGAGKEAASNPLAPEAGLDLPGREERAPCAEEGPSWP